MATLTMMRRPLVSLGAGQLRCLQKTSDNLLNQQMGPAACAASDSDRENVSPVMFKSAPKRKRSLEDDELQKELPKPIKTSRISCTTSRLEVIEPKATLNSQINCPSTPRSHRPLKKPAGRSPSSKSYKPFGRPSIRPSGRLGSTSKPTSSRAPFSVNTALSATKMKNPARSKPASWAFSIHADTKEEEMTNLVQHSTCILDISDDEDKIKAKGDERGKENIPPSELGIDLPGSLPIGSTIEAATIARKTVMTDEPRTPLGELNSTEYYADGCDDLSFVVVYDDEPKGETTLTYFEAPITPSGSLTHSSESPAPDDNPQQAALDEPQAAPDDSAATESEFEIWESGSAAEEAVNTVEEAISIFTSEPL